MATLTVWKFDTPDGAERATETLADLQKQELIKVHDAAVVSWPEGRKKPKTRQLSGLAGAGALGGAFWGLLFGSSASSSSSPCSGWPSGPPWAPSRAR
jgi:uncharacterized membrane protein